MKFASLLLSFLFAAITISAQVNPQCPNISVTGPAGIPQPGEPIPFSVTVKPTESTLTYKWTVTSGSIVSGQGTAAIQVKRQPDELFPTATVEIGGLSDECPKLASESSDGGDPPPQPEKLDTFSLPLSSASDQRFKCVVDSLNNYPSAQLYVLLPTGKEVRDTFVAKFDRFTHKGIDPARITFVEMNGESKIVEVWLVPPGATPPKECEACAQLGPAKPDCPTISIVGPPGVTAPGTLMRFTAKVENGEFKGIYKWTVSAGTIEAGQGTPSIKTRAPSKEAGELTATVEFEGLSQRCPVTASETAYFASGGLAIELDQYGKLSANEEKARLMNAYEQLKKETDMVLLIAIRVPNSKGISYEARVRTIRSRLITLRQNIDKAVFVDVGTGELLTRIYLIPPSQVPSLVRGIVQ